MRRIFVKMIVTMKDVADEAGVSVSTVSRAINGKLNENNIMIEKIWKAIDKLDYKPNPAARFMKGQPTGTIGVLLPDISNPFFTGIAAGAITQAQKYDNNLIISSSNGSIEQEKKSLEHLSRSVLDGLIYCPIARNESFDEIEFFKNIPVVISYRRDIIPGRPHVYVDNIKGGYIAAKYLLRLKRKHICFIAGFWNAPFESRDLIDMIDTPETGFFTSLDRFRGYLNALEEEKIPYDPSLVFISKYDYDSGYEIAKKIIESGREVDAILAPNDLVASGIIKFLTEQEISVPQEISVIGYDDSLIAPITNPTLSSVNQNSEEVGKKSVNLMMKLLNGDTPEDEIIDVSLSIRKSTSYLNETINKK